MTLESSDGFVRVVARRDNHLIVGWQAVGHGVSELSTAFCHSIEMGERLEDTAGTSTPTRRSAKRCRKRRCARSGIRCMWRAPRVRPRRRGGREPRAHHSAETNRAWLSRLPSTDNPNMCMRSAT